jgi:hypothetical protein
LIYAVTVAVDIQTIDAGLPGRLMGGNRMIPGAARTIPGGMIVFQSAALSDTPGEPSLFRFVAQFGARQGAELLGTWLFTQLRGAAAALSLAGHPVPIEHHAIIAGLKQIA